MLGRLRGDALHIWSDPTVRHEALEAIVVSWERGSIDLDRRVSRVDRAIIAGLRAGGLPRGPVLSVAIVPGLPLWAGRKLPSCHLFLSGERMREMVRVRHESDDVIRTWVHESLHARQPYSPAAETEIRPYQGYEEGMVEGLARLVTRDLAGMHPLELSYAYYVAAYEGLADAVGVDVEVVWRSLWLYRTGEVRAVFADVVDQLRRQAGRQPLTEAQRTRVLGAGDTLFASTRRLSPPARGAAAALWRVALQ